MCARACARVCMQAYNYTCLGVFYLVAFHHTVLFKHLRRVCVRVRVCVWVYVCARASMRCYLHGIEFVVVVLPYQHHLTETTFSDHLNVHVFMVCA